MLFAGEHGEKTLRKFTKFDEETEHMFPIGLYRNLFVNLSLNDVTYVLTVTRCRGSKSSAFIQQSAEISGMATRCGQCLSESGITVEESTLPCGHLVCQKCVNEQSKTSLRTYNLSCPECESKFALKHPRDPQCEKSTVIFLSPTFVADKYLADVKQNHCIRSRNRKKSWEWRLILPQMNYSS